MKKILAVFLLTFIYCAANSQILSPATVKDFSEHFIFEYKYGNPDYKNFINAAMYRIYQFPVSTTAITVEKCGKDTAALKKVLQSFYYISHNNPETLFTNVYAIDVAAEHANEIKTFAEKYLEEIY
jgi:hypothetical protein